MRKYDTIIWDMDGTLLDTLDDLMDSVNFTMRHYGLPERSRAEIRRFVGNGANVLLRLSVPGGEAHPQFDEILAFFRRHYASDNSGKTCVYPGLSAVLERLRDGGFHMAVVSNKPDAAVQPLSRLYLDGLMELSMGEAEARGIRKKPSPDMVLAAMGELGAKPERTVYIGDSEVDIATAKNAGLDCVTVLWGFRDRDELIEAGATVLIDTPEALEEYLNNKGEAL